MSSLKEAAKSAFASLNLTREEREQLMVDDSAELAEVVKNIITVNLDRLLKEINDFDKDFWMIGDECGKAVLVLRDRVWGESESLGELQAVLVEDGEIYVKISLDKIFEDGFEPLILTSRERSAIWLVENVVTEIKATYEINTLKLYLEGKDILSK